mmetsp:Transcript_838/g.1936  ORF Transcript_838/g.1936 Transcript_838/m.1936 type:complete len:96 (-) Transcript_838:894-1181(-)
MLRHLLTMASVLVRYMDHVESFRFASSNTEFNLKPATESKLGAPWRKADESNCDYFSLFKNRASHLKLEKSQKNFFHPDQTFVSCNNNSFQRRMP